MMNPQPQEQPQEQEQQQQTQAPREVRRRVRWNRDEDDTLLRLMREAPSLKEGYMVAEAALAPRTWKQCRTRYEYFMRLVRRRGGEDVFGLTSKHYPKIRWTDLEKHMFELVLLSSGYNARVMSDFIGTRTPQQVRQYAKYVYCVYHPEQAHLILATVKRRRRRAEAAAN